MIIVHYLKPLWLLFFYPRCQSGLSVCFKRILAGKLDSFPSVPLCDALFALCSLFLDFGYDVV